MAKLFNTRKFVSAMNQLEKANRRQEKYNSQQNFINEAQKTQIKFQKHYGLFRDLLIQNLNLQQDFLDNYIRYLYPKENIKAKNRFIVFLTHIFLPGLVIIQKGFGKTGRILLLIQFAVVILFIPSLTLELILPNYGAKLFFFSGSTSLLSYFPILITSLLFIDKKELDKYKQHTILRGIKKHQILLGYRNNKIDDYINAVYFSIKCPAVKDFNDIDFILKDKTLIFDHQLLDIGSSLDYKDVSYNSKSIKYIAFKKGEKKELFIQYYNQIALAVVNLLFQCDTENIFEEICYNGWIDTVDKQTGQKMEVCVVSLSVSKEKFQKLNLQSVDPVECVKYLNGRTEINIESVSVEGVKPILQFNFDRKIVEANNVIDSMKSNNLMDLTWEEFEVLVRDWLRKEFENAKVEVTQASRDGGIDAIIYDDDILRGGVTLVQVKQYNIVVPVSAVRDLYGVMQDRRASKGILVTTSNFGSDSRKFARDKPISLINGGDLLYFLNKNGYNTEIKKVRK